jgi:hypothetical protein
MVVSLVLAGLLVPARLLAQKCVVPGCGSKYYCVGSAAAERLPNAVEIDANTCSVNGSTRFPQDARIQVIITAKNPFKYKYQVTYQTRPLEEAIAWSFVQGLFPDLTAFLGKVLPSQFDTEACAEGDFAVVDTALDAANIAIGALTADVKRKADGPAKDLDKFFADTDKETIECTDADGLWGRAQTLLSQLDLGDLPARAAAAVKQAETLQQTLATARLTGKCSFDRGNAVDKVNSTAKGLKERVDKLDSQFKLGKQILSLALADPNPFVQVLYPQTSDGPTLVTLNLSRQNLRVAGSKMEATCNPIQIQSGKSRFSVSAGAGFSTLPDRHIIRQPSKGDQAGTPINKFGYESNAAFKPSGVAMLNASLKKLGRGASTLAASLGVVVSGRGEAAQLEFVAGPSFAFVDEKFFLTFGFHAAKVEKLAGGFNIGDPVPSSLPEPPPIQKDWRPGFMIAMTFKIR